MVVVLLSNQGYWFGGQEGEVRVQLAVNVSAADTVFYWELVFGSKIIQSGNMALRSDEKPATLKLTPPKVRVPTSLRLVYRLYPKIATPKNKTDAKRELLSGGEMAIRLFPQNMLESIPRQLKGKKLVVWDAEDGLPSLFDEVKVPHERIDRLKPFAFRRPDILIVAADQLSSQQNDQQKLLGHLHSGTSVLILDQPQAKSLFDYEQVERNASLLQWRESHVLARHRREYAELLTGKMVLMFRIAADDPTLEIAYLPAQAKAKRPHPFTPIDAVLATKTVGKGRVVICRLPLGPWKTDPRSQLFLADAIDHLASPIEPTPRPSQRIQKQGSKRIMPKEGNPSEMQKTFLGEEK
jgi:hypothetical protein